MSPSLKCPVAVIAWRGIPTIYERRPDGHGGSVLHVHELGRSAPLEVTPELLAAIEADERRSRERQQH
ncbi:MAG TPA: hypothetical protein VLI06_02545 [Solimonas sp.]|nr:hypothetical protein [Solimonas sp.]